MAQFHYQIGNKGKTVRVERTGATFAVTIGDQRYTVEAKPGTNGRLRLSIGGERTTAIVATGERTDPARYVWLAGESWVLSRTTELRRRQATSPLVATDSITAPMPGQILDLLVAPGATVAPGEPLVVLGAMKMETQIVAPHAGMVTTVECAVGGTVQRGQLLMQLTPVTTPSSATMQ
jgi:biotin carboxyl carrier protein